jgi:hypothetical protein
VAAPRSATAAPRSTTAAPQIAPQELRLQRGGVVWASARGDCVLGGVGSGVRTGGERERATTGGLHHEERGDAFLAILWASTENGSGVWVMRWKVFWVGKSTIGDAFWVCLSWLETVLGTENFSPSVAATLHLGVSSSRKFLALATITLSFIFIN